MSGPISVIAESSVMDRDFSTVEGALMWAKATREWCDIWRGKAWLGKVSPSGVVTGRHPTNEPRLP